VAIDVILEPALAPSADGAPEAVGDQRPETEAEDYGQKREAWNLARMHDWAVLGLLATTQCIWLVALGYGLYSRLL
jgi:hypothetical protein